MTQVDDISELKKNARIHTIIALGQAFFGIPLLIGSVCVVNWLGLLVGFLFVACAISQANNAIYAIKRIRLLKSLRSKQ